mmetsp:Transcript_22041/g.77267  ORF Transcript_22041/g.77267 Transcript_22041/m.77267 type:complete len:200 (-) Transcript_22041:1376-1975(-)
MWRDSACCAGVRTTASATAPRNWSLKPSGVAARCCTMSEASPTASSPALERASAVSSGAPGTQSKSSSATDTKGPPSSVATATTQPSPPSSSSPPTPPTCTTHSAAAPPSSVTKTCGLKPSGAPSALPDSRPAARSRTEAMAAATAMSVVRSPSPSCTPLKPSGYSSSMKPVVSAPDTKRGCATTSRQKLALWPTPRMT